MKRKVASTRFENSRQEPFVNFSRSRVKISGLMIRSYDEQTSVRKSQNRRFSISKHWKKSRMKGNRKSIVSRSAYINRLRRAFILRCHPDRFRQHDDAIRKQQSVLLQVREANHQIECNIWYSRRAKPMFFFVFTSTTVTYI